ncbi:uncharacterized protein LOC129743790 [Uranotaenia lowii]|uniref:uncharacterized protein LOC129743790 n=1 Tax=Uranotaenia lowii TaxID=190385 RepID=UPI00247AABED|nr:uncharacterized protein LOC129743790 [Uranotaenia lowii]
MCQTKSYFIVIAHILLVLSVTSIAEKREMQEAFCPKMCTCDTIEGLKRADCSHENLINTYTDVPTGVEILDLSINMISTIDDDSFEAYVNLVKLFLSENSIDHISLNAFSTLANLESLDLSHNRLQMLHANLFEHNEKLTDLNLSNNNFMNLQSRPFLSSSSIMYLDISHCKIPQLYNNMFVQLPNLRTLDLGANLMITLEKEPFVKLRKMHTISLTENQWQCDSMSVRATVNWMKKKMSTINIENCFINPYTKKPRFEKMELDPNGPGSATRKDVPIEQVWPGQEKANNFSSLKSKICAPDHVDNREQCEFIIDLYQAYINQQPASNKKTTYFFGSNLGLILLLCGLLIGVLFGSFTTYSAMYLYQKCRNATNGNEPSEKSERQLRRELRNRKRFEHTRLNESPDPTANRQTVSHLSSREQSQIYRNHEHTRQFLVDLFSKRQPRYVRSNSQLANLNNRHIPPSPIRAELRTPQSASPAAASSSSFIWETTRQNQDNQERERMLERSSSRESSSMSVWNNLYGIDEVRRSVNGTPTTDPYEVLPIVADSGTPIVIHRETPPPPYVDCTVRLSQR